MNIVAICLNVLLPWILFSSIAAAMSFSLHYDHAALVHFIIFAGVLVVVVAIGLAFRAWRVKTSQRRNNAVHDPTWFIFAAVALTIALVAAVVVGDINFYYNLMPYYDYTNLNTYPSVDPTKDRGEALMDGGRVYFVQGTQLDRTKSMTFRNMDHYCVAPIVRGTETLAFYDFWAVGLNCCAHDFRCGQFNNPYARSGLRLMRDEQRAFFRLAVQQAESTYKIKAEHPLFFHWMQDPIAEVNGYREEGIKFYLFGVFTHLVFSIFIVACAVIAFSKIGRY